MCQLAYRDQSSADTVFNSARIAVNGIRLTHQGTAGTFSGNGLMLSAGDSVVFTIQHQLVGTIQQMLRVPPSITDCILQPSMPQKGVENQSTSYSVAWGTGAVGAEYYLLTAVSYDSSGSVVTSWSTRTGSNTLTFPSWVFQETSGGPCPYLDITILPFNSISYPGFAGGSQFSVSSAGYKEYTNF